MNTRIHHCWSLKIWKKKNYSPNDRFLIKFFIKISSFDSSQRVPPMSPYAPLTIIRGFPLLINPFQGGVYLRGKLRKTLQGTYLPCGGGQLINPMLALYVYIYKATPPRSHHHRRGSEHLGSFLHRSPGVAPSRPERPDPPPEDPWEGRSCLSHQGREP